MKRNIFKALVIALVLPTAFAMTSCKEQPNSKELYLYLNTEIQPINQNELAVNVEIRKGGNVIKVTGQQSLLFPVKASRPLPASATATFGASPSKLSDYNKQFEAKALLLPDQFVVMNDGAKLTVREGQIMSADSMLVKVVNLENLNIVGNPTYVYPLTITSISSDDKGLALSSNMNTIYVVVKVSSEEFNMAMATEADMTGASLENIPANITAKGSSGTTSLVDKKITPSWNVSQNVNAYALFDLQSERTITGFPVLGLATLIRRRL